MAAPTRFTRQFQHTAARRRLQVDVIGLCCDMCVSTHSRPKAAARFAIRQICENQFQHTAARRRLLELTGYDYDFSPVSTHSRPKAAAQSEAGDFDAGAVSTHSRPKAAATALDNRIANLSVSTHSRPKAAAALSKQYVSVELFQHTAARRRLRFRAMSVKEAACFNTQPPEGGCPP